VHRITLELVAVIACPHVGLLASKLGGKASTNLGAPHGVDLTEADPSTYSGIRAQLNAISESATKLLEKLDELEKGGDPDGAAD
jgi:hypothetical protein